MTPSPPPSFSFPHRARRRGMALMTVLALVAILTVLVVAFLSRALLDRQISESSASGTGADLFAQGALNTIVGDLLDEIVAGSNRSVPGSYYLNAPIASSTLPNGKSLAIPSTAATIVPAVSLPSSLGTGSSSWLLPTAANLVKISQGGLSFYPSGPPYGAGTPSSRATAVGTRTASLNGRTISLARWNKALLLPKSNPGSTTDLTPQAGAFADPDWVLVARDGGNPGGAGTTADFGPTGSTVNNPLATNTKFVVGRYAYAIYDEGGLLDANAVGGPAVAPPASLSGVRALNYKNSEAFVDLSQLTAATSLSDSVAPLLSSATINNLVGWRNYASALATGRFPSLLPDWGSYYGNILHNVSPGFVTGFLRPARLAAGAVVNNQTDRMFASRQQLIDFLVASDPGNVPNTQAALQYLTHFSRDLEQPLIIPNPNRPKIISGGYTGSGAPALTGGNTEYQNDTDDPTGPAPKYVNPNFLNVQGSDGNPVVIKRFPLNRLALLTSSATGSSGSGAIYVYFGLSRLSSSQPWIYNHGGNGRILTLSEVAKLTPPRDPDFLEMLKGAIVAGSLGKGAYPAGDVVSVASQEMLLDTSVDFQVMQIAANLIDQYKADNYPTRITPSSNWSGSAAANLAEIFSGDEDLPYFYRLRRRPVQVTAITNPTTGPQGKLLLVPEIWNPHMQNSNDAALSGPTSFRMWMETPPGSSTSTVSVFTQWPIPPSTTALRTVYSDPNPTTITRTTGLFSFNQEAVSSAYYRQPTVLAQPGLPYSQIAGPGITDVNNLQLLGWPMGSIYYDQNGQAPADWDMDDTNGIFLHLEYKTGSTWVEYQELYFNQSTLSFPFRAYTGSTAAPNWGPWAFQTAYDPRTTRFGTPADDGINTFPSIGGGPNPQTFDTISKGAPPALPVVNLRRFYPTTFQPSATSTSNIGLFQQNLYASGNYFGDPDNVVRPAMGSFASGQVGLPMADVVTGPQGTAAASDETSRPLVLHRPFRSVAEMGYAFTGTPWRNIDFSNPQSGTSTLLEAFCLNESERADGMVAGRVSLNTRQLPVLKALFHGAYVDEFGTPAALSAAGANSAPYLLAKTLLARTESASTGTGLGPLGSRADLVGRLLMSTVSASSGPTPVPGPTYIGFASDSKNTGLDVSTALSAGNISNVTRWRESAVRALADVGTARVWNLMIDVIAQTGRYPQTAHTAADFLVEGERRYWLHVAIDRFTGKILDQQLEPVSE